MKGVWKNYLKI